MRLPVFILAFVILLPACVRSQSWRAGYLVNVDGERLQGLINDEGWERSPVTIQFKSGPSAIIESYSAENISSFGIEGAEQYAVFNVEYDPDSQSERNSKALPNSREPQNMMRGTFMMQEWVLGNISLYEWIDPNGRKHYFLRKGDGLPEELIYRRYRSTDEKNEDVIRINTRFRQQLHQATADCTTQLNVEKVDYAARELQSLVNAYNACNGSESTYSYIPPKSPSYFGVLGEVFLYQANLGYPETSFGPPHIGAGLSYEIVNPKRNGLYSLLFEAKFRILEQDGEDTYYNEDAVFKVNDFRFVFMPRFNYPLGESNQWFWNLGVAFSMDFNSIITYTDGQQIYANSYVGVDYGFAMGFGATVFSNPKSALALELRYEQGDGFHRVFNFGQGIQSFALNVTYRIKSGK